MTIRNLRERMEDCMFENISRPSNTERGFKKDLNPGEVLYPSKLWIVSGGVDLLYTARGGTKTTKRNRFTIHWLNRKGVVFFPSTRTGIQGVLDALSILSSEEE